MVDRRQLTRQTYTQIRPDKQCVGADFFAMALR